MLRYVDGRQVRAGDRVVMAMPIDSEEEPPIGAWGTVDHIGTYDFGVIFDSWRKGHDFWDKGSLEQGDNRGWWCRPEEMLCVRPIDLFGEGCDIIADALHTLLLSFEEGKRIDKYNVDEAWFGKVREVLAKLEGESCK